MWAKLAKKTLNIRGKYALMLLCFLLLAHPAAAVRVAVVIDTPGQLIAKCVTTSPDANAYAIMQQTGQNIAWAYYGQALGHGLCSITGIGCPSSNCYCDPDSYWNFYAKEAGGEWTYSAVGFDGGTSCAEHYCAEEGEMLGFAYGSYGTAPAGYTFGEVCCSMPGDGAPCGSVSLEEVIGYINSWTEGSAELGDVIALINEWTTS
jgi:hypothetical protein